MVELPDEVFAAVRQFADAAQATPEAIAADILRQRFGATRSSPAAPAASPPGLYEQMADIVGSVASAEGGRARHTGQAFARLLARKPSTVDEK